MGATPMSRSLSSAPRKDPRGPGRAVSRRRAAALEALYRQLHAQLIAENRPVSGRAGRYVYYWAYGHLCWRVYVVPKDPRTAVQQRSRAAFAAASTAWSGSQSLTEEQRVAWFAAAAKIKSTPRLGQSGPLTAQQHFVGRNSLKERWGSAMLLEPLDGGRENAECRKQNLSKLRDLPRVLAGPAPDQRRPRPRQQERLRRRPLLQFAHRNCLSPSALRDPPRVATVMPPYPFRGNAGARHGPLATSAALGRSDFRPRFPKSLEPPASADSGVAASAAAPILP